jgi:hypothetical protein
MRSGGPCLSGSGAMDRYLQVHGFEYLGTIEEILP